MWSENGDWAMKANDKVILWLFISLSYVFTSHSCQMAFSSAPHFVLQQHGPKCLMENVLQSILLSFLDDSEKKEHVSASQHSNSKNGNQSTASVSFNETKPSVFTVGEIPLVCSWSWWSWSPPHIKSFHVFWFVHEIICRNVHLLCSRVWQRRFLPARDNYL